jgi:hypothetical protein
MYTAILLDSNSRNKIMDAVPGGRELIASLKWYTKCHHVTLNMGGFNSSLNPTEILGANVTARVGTAFFSREWGILAVDVKHIYAHLGDRSRGPSLRPVVSINKYPHVTVAHDPEVKPVRANTMIGVEEAHTGRSNTLGCTITSERIPEIYIHGVVTEIAV